MFTSINPATGEPGESFKELDADGVELALARAQTCFEAWRNSPLEQRTALLSAIADQWEANKQHLAETAVKEMGKPITGAIAEVADDYPRPVETPGEIAEWEALMWRFQRALPHAAPGEKWVPMQRIFAFDGTR